MKINFKKLSYVLMALVIAMTLVVSMGNVFAEEAGKISKHPLGAEDNVKNAFAKAPSKDKIKAEDIKVSLPAVIDHSDKMPAVGNQGAIGSCVGWAASYLKAGQEFDDQGWGNVMFSPSFIYNQINLDDYSPSGGGAYTIDAMHLLYNNGVCKLATMPYTEDFTLMPNASQFGEAENFKSTDVYGYYYSDGYSAATVDDLKYWLSEQDDCVILSVPVYPSFDAGVFDSLSGSSRGGHAICLVGYNDSTERLKFINSWGSDWADNGYGYITYDIWNQLVSMDVVGSYASIDEKTGPVDPPAPKYKYTLTFKDARVVATGSHSAGNQWGVAVKNESQSTTVMYKRQDNSNPITADKSIQTNYDGCYVGLHEYEANPIYDDRANKVISSLNEGDNVVYLTCKDNQYSDYWSKWKFVINRKTN